MDDLQLVSHYIHKMKQLNRAWKKVIEWEARMSYYGAAMNPDLARAICCCMRRDKWRRFVTAIEKKFCL